VEAVFEGAMRIGADSSRVLNLGGRTSIVQLAALLRRASVFVGNDGGTCHLAIGVGCRVVSIANTAEIPDSVEPWGCQRFTARGDVPCAPCYCFTSCPRGDSICVTTVSPEAVMRLVNSALSEARSGVRL